MEKMSATSRVINWFEIPVIEMDRATRFYEAIFDIQMVPYDFPGMKMTGFPADMSNEATSGALVKDEMSKPGTDGTTIYLNASPKIQLVLDRVTQAGGQIVVPRTLINEETGYFAIIIDTEGNKIGLHAGQ